MLLMLRLKPILLIFILSTSTLLAQEKINMQTLTPNLFVSDINHSIDFYKKIGFEIVMTVPEQGDFVWVMMKCGNVNMMLQTLSSLGNELPQINRKPGGSLLLYINTTDIRIFFESIKDKVTVLKGLEKTFYGATEFSIADPDGFVITFAEDEK